MDMNYGAIKKIDEIEIELETGTRERASVVIEKMKESWNKQTRFEKKKWYTYTLRILYAKHI